MKAETIIGPVAIVEKPERAYLGIRLQTPFPGMFAVATRALKELRAWTKSHGCSEDGPYFLRYYHCDMRDIMEVEAGFVTDAPTPDHPTIKAGLLPGGRYASLTYRGNGLRANQALMQWGRENANPFEPIDEKLPESYVSRYEAYLTDYRIEPRKLLWEVELSIKLGN